MTAVLSCERSESLGCCSAGIHWELAVLAVMPRHCCKARLHRRHNISTGPANCAGQREWLVRVFPSGPTSTVGCRCLTEATAAQNKTQLLPKPVPRRLHESLVTAQATHSLDHQACTRSGPAPETPFVPRPEHMQQPLPRTCVTAAQHSLAAALLLCNLDATTSFFLVFECGGDQDRPVRTPFFEAFTATPPSLPPQLGAAPTGPCQAAALGPGASGNRTLSGACPGPFQAPAPCAVDTTRPAESLTSLRRSHGARSTPEQSRRRSGPASSALAPRNRCCQPHAHI